MTNTYVLVVKGFLCPSRNSSSPGNNLHCVSGYRSRHSNTVCPGWERSSRLADQGSTYWLDLHSTNPAGLNSRALHLLPSVSAVLQSWPSTVHSTFCEYNNSTEWLSCTLTYLTRGLPETWGAPGWLKADSHYTSRFHSVAKRRRSVKLSHV